MWQLRLQSLNHHTSTSLLLSVWCTLIANSWEMFYFHQLESTSQIKTLNWDTRYTASPLNCFPWLRLRNWIFPGSSWSNWIKSCQYRRHNSIKLPANEDTVCYAPGRNWFSSPFLSHLRVHEVICIRLSHTLCMVVQLLYKKTDLPWPINMFNDMPVWARLCNLI